jgi:hypothetical protein
MAFHVTYEPRNRIAGVKPRTVTKETAAEALKLVLGLEMSDEIASVKTDSGRPIEQWELRDMADAESK